MVALGNSEEAVAHPCPSFFQYFLLFHFATFPLDFLGNNNNKFVDHNIFASKPIGRMKGSSPEASPNMKGKMGLDATKGHSF
jgi:hypothetical protein